VAIQAFLLDYLLDVFWIFYLDCFAALAMTWKTFGNCS